MEDLLFDLLKLGITHSSREPNCISHTKELVCLLWVVESEEIYLVD